MTPEEYRTFCKTVAQYPEAGTRKPAAINYTILGLVGEAGELADKWKKVLRDDEGVLTPEKRVEMRKELGDVLWYLERASVELGTNIPTLMQENMEKLQSRKDRDVLGGSGDNR